MKSLIALAAAAVATPAFALQVVPVAPPAAPAPAPVDPEALAAAHALLISVNFNDQVERTIRQMTDSTFDTVMSAEERSLGITMPDDLKQTVRALIRQHQEELIADMKLSALDQAARVYAKYFTADELRELQRLQTNPVLAKAQRLAPQLTTDLAQIGMGIAVKHMPELRSQIQAAVRDWIAKHKETAPRNS
jgi:hypothetical protein